MPLITKSAGRILVCLTLALGFAACDNGPEGDPDRFDAMCIAMNDAGCSSGLNSCKSDWNNASSRCPTEVDALLACTGSNPTVTCNGGVPIFDGCENESSAAILCAVQ